MKWGCLFALLKSNQRIDRSYKINSGLKKVQTIQGKDFMKMFKLDKADAFCQ